MANPVLIEVTRGPLVESWHRGSLAVAGPSGALALALGDVASPVYPRSAIKALQALPLIETGAADRFGYGAAEIALACGSHAGTERHASLAASMLKRARLAPAALHCGPHAPLGASAANALIAAGEAPTQLHNNCSGKHAGMLALCRAHGWASGGYRLATHPVQHACLAEVSAAADVPADEIPTAVDGCGVVTFALPLERMALLFSRLEQVEGGATVAAAMRAHPELIRGPVAADSLLMRELEGWTAKGGAEGLMCAVGPDGLGIALKVEDGSMRAMRPALAEFLRRLGLETGELGVEPVENSRGELVGEVVAER
jgi:L-asparaginase II